MNSKINKFCLLLLCLAITATALAQNYLKSPQEVENELKSDLDYLFQALDKSKITSGLLSNYALELAELAPYNGVLSDTNQINMSVLLNLYRSIYSAKINNLISLATPETIAEQINNSSIVNNVVPVAILHYEYDCFNENAVNNGWLSYSGGRLRDVAGKPSPYLKKHLFVAAPKEQVFRNGTAAFVFKPDLFYRNNNKTVSGLYIKFDNSNWLSVSWNTAVSHTFASGGNKTVQFKIQYSDGSAYLSHTGIYVQVTPTPLRAANGAPYTNRTETIAANSLHSGGTLEMHLQNPALGLRKPLIIAEPFDMSATLTVATAYNLDYIISQSPAMQAFIDSLKYDVVYVNYNNGLDDIFRNAELLKEAIRRVNNAKDKTLNHPNAVIGVSMGGLVARYALSGMEAQGEEHDTWQYISLDSPHKGANLPLGLQAMVRHIESLLHEYGGGSSGDIVNQLFGVLNSTAAKQMLIYYCASDGSINNSVHTAFQTKYDAMGFPKKCRNIAVSNGAVQGNILFNPYTEIFNYQPGMNELMSFVGMEIWLQIVINAGLVLADMFTLGGHSFNAEFSVHALPDKKVSIIYNGYAYYRKYFLLGLFRKTFHLTGRLLNSEAYMLPLDGAAGSFNKFDIGNNSNDAKIDTLLTYFKKKEFTFVPASSALALSKWDTMINTNLNGRDLYAEGLTEFEDILITSNNKEHADFTHAAPYLAKQLAAPPVSFNLASTGFNTSTTIPLKNPQNASVSWSVSNSNFSLLNTSNTSATLFCDKPDITGIVTVSNTVTVPPAMASALGIGSSFQMQQRKRMKSLGAMQIAGSFPEGSPTATLHIPNLPSGAPVSWSLSDSNNFRKVSASGNSLTIEALAYNQPLTVSATVQLQSKNVSVQKSLTSPALSISIPLLDCRETAVSLSPVLPGSESFSWSIGSYEQYIGLSGATNGSSVQVYGKKNTGIESSQKGNLTVKVRVRGKEVSATQEAKVAIPAGLTIYVLSTTKESTYTQVELWAKPYPYNMYAGTFHWSTDNGFFMKKVKEAELLARNANDFKTMTSNYIIPVDEISPELLEELLANANVDRELTEGNSSVTLTQAATLSSENKLQSVIVGVDVSIDPITGERQTQYFQIQNPDKLDSDLLTYFPLDIGDPYPFPCYSEDDPSYIILRYTGKNPTVTCRLTSPCINLITTMPLTSNASYSCGYSVESGSITVSNDDLSSGGNRNPGDSYTATYLVSIYDDYRMVKQVKISSAEAKAFIPMTGYPAGYYYVNISDETGNIVTRQTVQVW